MKTKPKIQRKPQRLGNLKQLGTVTMTRGEAAALVSGIGVALKYEDVPKDIAPRLANALQKLNVAFGLWTEGGK